ncbi:MAG: hypothetical protein ACK6DC_23225 [Planctomycetota bacterium]|jgi:hypothetical protein
MKSPFFALVNHAASAMQAFETFRSCVLRIGEKSDDDDVEWLYGDKFMVDWESIANAYREEIASRDSSGKTPIRECLSKFIELSDNLDRGTCLIVPVSDGANQWAIMGYAGTD